MQEVAIFHVIHFDPAEFSSVICWCPADSVVQQAAQALGQKVVLRHYLVTVRGRTGYLDPKWEECTITGSCHVLLCSLYPPPISSKHFCAAKWLYLT